jgi:hypothetical protein
MNEQEIKLKIQALEILNELVRTLYPDGSQAIFHDKIVDEKQLFDCTWCDRIGEKDRSGTLLNQESNPEDLQNLTEDKMQEISNRFQNAMIVIDNRNEWKMILKDRNQQVSGPGEQGENSSRS